MPGDGFQGPEMNPVRTYVSYDPEQRDNAQTFPRQTFQSSACEAFFQMADRRHVPFVGARYIRSSARPLTQLAGGALTADATLVSAQTALLGSPVHDYNDYSSK